MNDDDEEENCVRNGEKIPTFCHLDQQIAVTAMVEKLMEKIKTAKSW